MAFDSTFCRSQKEAAPHDAKGHAVQHYPIRIRWATGMY